MKRMNLFYHIGDPRCPEEPEYEYDHEDEEIERQEVVRDRRIDRDNEKW